jgi:hypothetical protein
MEGFKKTSAYTSFSQTGRERKIVCDYFLLFRPVSQTVGHDKVVCRSFLRLPRLIPSRRSLFAFLPGATRR